MANARYSASDRGFVPANKTIDHITQLLTTLQKDQKYKEHAKLALDQWKKTLEDMKILQSKEEIKPSQKKAEKEQEKDMRISSLERHVKELTQRLSTLASDRMSDNNPDITDLSDPYRPAKLAEMFKDVYNEEWTDAFQYYDSVFKNEDMVLDALALFPKDIYRFCRELFKQQSEELEAHTQYMFKVMTEVKFKVDQQNHVCAKKDESAREAYKEEKDLGRTHIKKLQKVMAKSSVRDLFEIYCGVSSFKKKPEWIQDVDNNEALKKFISKLLEIIWLMTCQDPPIVLKSLEPDTRMDKTSFMFYTKSGDLAQRTVWPAVHLHEKGPLLAKGVIQTK